jgi:hypothetical protein
MKFLRYSIIVLLSLNLLNSFAGDILPDGTKATQTYIDTIKKYYNKEDSTYFDTENVGLSARVPVRVHIIKNVKGKSGISESDINTSITTANSYLSNCGIKLYIDSVHYINDYNYSFITGNNNRTELLKLYAVSGKINLFLADSVYVEGERCYGYTYFPDATDSNYIFLDKEYISGKYLTTLIGHFMGLLSTHETLGDNELVSEKNCASSGDYICDTYADPNLYEQVDSTCQYTGSDKDSNGKYYVPTVANIMSESKDECKCIFTPLQYKRMYYYFIKFRQGILK